MGHPNKNTQSVNNNSSNNIHCKYVINMPNNYIQSIPCQYMPCGCPNYPPLCGCNCLCTCTCIQPNVSTTLYSSSFQCYTNCQPVYQNTICETSYLGNTCSTTCNTSYSNQPLPCPPQPYYPCYPCPPNPCPPHPCPPCPPLNTDPNCYNPYPHPVVPNCHPQPPCYPPPPCIPCHPPCPPKCQGPFYVVYEPICVKYESDYNKVKNCNNKK